MRASAEWLERGGKWLGAVRSWLQWNTHNGDRVTWGSNQAIEPPITARQVEEIGAVAAEAVAGELIENEKQLSKLRSKCLMLECELASIISHLERLGETWQKWENK